MDGKSKIETKYKIWESERQSLMKNYEDSTWRSKYAINFQIAFTNQTIILLNMLIVCVCVWEMRLHVKWIKLLLFIWTPQLVLPYDYHTIKHDTLFFELNVATTETKLEKKWWTLWLCLQTVCVWFCLLFLHAWCREILYGMLHVFTSHTAANLKDIDKKKRAKKKIIFFLQSKEIKWKKNCS